MLSVAFSDTASGKTKRIINEITKTTNDRNAREPYNSEYFSR